MKKQCGKCKGIKELFEFPKVSKNKDGRAYTCKICRNIEKREFYKLHPEVVKKWNDKSVKKRLDKCKQYRHDYYLLHKEKIKKYCEVRYLNNKEKIKKRIKQWNINNPEKIQIYSKRKGVKRRSTAKGKLSRNMAYRIWTSLRTNKNNQHWENLVDYNIDQLKSHLEKQFTVGMNWENYGQWHIDHKEPICSFDYLCPKDISFKQCWGLGNLQPLWAFDNLSKGARIAW